MRSLKMCFFACCNRYGNSSLAFMFRRIGMAHGESYVALVQFWPSVNKWLVNVVGFHLVQHSSFSPP